MTEGNLDSVVVKYLRNDGLMLIEWLSRLLNVCFVLGVMPID